jgi:hypothetical protein
VVEPTSTGENPQKGLISDVYGELLVVRTLLAASCLVGLAVVVGTVPGARALAADNTPPVVTYSIDGIAGSNNWYRGSAHGDNVTVHWSVSDPESQIISTTGCDPAIQIPGPSGGTNRTCRATSDGGTTTVTTKAIKIDATAPAVSGAASRGPDANSWYNHAVTISFSGRDATSGLAACSRATYAGPDNAQASVAGTCTDNAGNVGRAAVGFAYDSTPPQLKKLGIRHGNRTLTFRWQVSPDTQRLVVARAPGKHKAAKSVLYSGKDKAYRDKGLSPGARYRYTVSAFDQAANEARKTVTVIATGALLGPLPGARVTRAPRLFWTPVKGASYYNVQLVRGGRIFSAWPSGTSLELPLSWVYKGHRHRLHAGVYRWFVWPGYGLLAANKYGHVLGRSSFLYAR